MSDWWIDETIVPGPDEHGAIIHPRGPMDVRVGPGPALYSCEVIEADFLENRPGDIVRLSIQTGIGLASPAMVIAVKVRALTRRGPEVAGGRPTHEMTFETL